MAIGVYLHLSTFTIIRLLSMSIGMFMTSTISMTMDRTILLASRIRMWTSMHQCRTDTPIILISTTGTGTS
jgi:hypothetical protein